MSDDRLDALIRKVYCYKPDDELYTELNTNDVSQYDTARQFAEFHLEQLGQLRAVLRPAVKSARERDELNLNSVSKLIGTERANKMALSYIDITEKTDQALLAAGEILGLTEKSAEESEAG